MRSSSIFLMLCGLVAAPALAADSETYSRQEILSQVEQFFGHGAKDLAQVVEKVFADQGEPDAYITGEEAGGAVGIGLRYGSGTLQTKTGVQRKVYWQGPSIGIDLGGAASKVFMLIYALRDPDQLFKRYPGVEGSLYYVGGIGVNYLRSGKVVIAPIRFGAGWRQGVSVGYLDFTRKPSINPF
ncbi:MAG: DUF1134 domain-containing protein [Thiohalocapsa sp.]|uniref:DUF1134 domain-containing protein n=1 Tax=Thiohalocapsa sp. TaxID=2497641 RepID=UPI0025FF266C|nr:DUF1134 domain-containing protein [Thiohalocapsa sp.]MCG6940901.1 DUF1134 domain-containing protein [Thiohalocapsa sp.]